MEKHIPFIGEKLYTYTPCSDGWVSMVHNPYTVIAVNEKATECIVQEAGMVFPYPRYFDTLPTRIFEDPNGRTKKFRWSEKKQRWQESPCGSYPEVAVFGRWDYQPYLN